jgi:hypothetical protein
MDQPHIFSATLGLFAPWHITAITFSDREKRIDITVETQSGETVSCPLCGADVPPGAAHFETWKHHNFFSHTAFIHIRIPCICCPHCNDTHVLPVPWAGEGSNFVRLDDNPAPTAAVQ